MSQFEKSLSVAALDIGYGETKLAWPTNEGRVQKSFRSIVEPANALDLSAGGVGKRRTAHVEVDGVSYEVGGDAELLAGRPHAGVLHDDFVNTAEYLALARALLLAWAQSGSSCW